MQKVAGKVAVIGAGPGGLASAMVLASKGLDVTVYEKADRVGGRCSHLNVEGVKFDVGPTFLMMKFVLEEVFRQSGKDVNKYMKNIQIEPMYRLDFNNNKKLDAYSQDKKELMFEQFSKTFPEDATNFNFWIQRETERYKRLIPLLQTPFLGYQSFLTLDAIKAIPHLSLGSSVSSILSKDFKNPLSQLSFAFQTKYLGMSPVEAPGFYNVVAFVEHMFGVYHTEGGLNSMNTGMAKAAQELGAKILLNTPVKEFVLKGKDIKGVKLANGQVEEYDKVVLNGDFMTSMEQLVPNAEQVLNRWKPSNLAKKRYSCSTFMLYIALDKVYTHHPHHSIIFCDDVPKNLKEISQGIIPDTPSIYLQNASVTDPTLAPNGKSGLYVLVPVPNLVAQTEAKAKEFWENPKHVADYRSRVLQIIKERCNMPDLEQHIIGEKMITPVQWKEQRGIYGGAVFSLAHNLTQMLVFRPRNKFEELNNLYLVGAGTNPGSGLPTIFESSLITSELICKEYGIPMQRVQYNTLNNWK